VIWREHNKRVAIFADEAFTFYEGLSADNSKTYWNAHKDTYEQAVREPMRELLEKLAPTFDADVSLFRPYRDVRFSKDKSPYKTAQGGFLELAPGVGYWMQIDAEGVMIGGGFHAHDRDQTNRYQGRAVDAQSSGPELVYITDKLGKAGLREVGGHQVRDPPRGGPADHPRLDFMRARIRQRAQIGSTRAVLTPALVQKEWKTVTPLVEWGAAHMHRRTWRRMKAQQGLRRARPRPSPAR
jgi:uncharacterized protein (TIGR02453 family)